MLKPLLLASLVLFSLGGFLWFQTEQQPTADVTATYPAAVTTTPPIKMSTRETTAPLPSIEPSPPTLETRAIEISPEELASKMLNEPERALTVTEADHFVSADQLLNVPEIQQALIAAGGFEAAATEPAEVKVFRMDTPSVEIIRADRSPAPQTIESAVSAVEESGSPTWLSLDKAKQLLEIMIGPSDPSREPSTTKVTGSLSNLSTTSPDSEVQFNQQAIKPTLTDPISEGRPVRLTALPNESYAPAPVSEKQVRLNQLLGSGKQAKDTVYYLHAVKADDRRGLWGILHSGLTRTFNRGIDLDRDGRIQQVSIPQGADQLLEDSRSSYLGQVLHQKVQESVVYNFKAGTLGRDPNLITPGQQLVISRFSHSELLEIYKHFAYQATNN